MVDAVLLINLPQRRDRLLSAVWRCYRSGIQPRIVAALEGGAEVEGLLRGEIGYLHTWRYILRSALNSTWQRLAVFDDDVYFHKDLERRLRQWRNHGLTWHLLYLGASQHHWDLIRADRGGSEMDWYYPVRTDGSFAVLIDRCCWGRALELIEKILAKEEGSIGPFDSAVLRRIVAENEGYCYVLSPNLVIADVGDSDIRGGRDRAAGAESCRWNYNQYDSGGERGLEGGENSWNPLPLVSAILPVYNREGTVGLALESLLAQDYPNLEILVVDDQSTDGTRAAVQTVMAAVPWRWPWWRGKIHLLASGVTGEANKGCYATRNVGLKWASGVYIAFQDSDDWSAPERLSTQLLGCWLNRVPWSQCLILRTHLRGEAWTAARELIGEEWRERILKARSHWLEGRYCCRAITGMVTGLFHRELFRQLGGFCCWPAAADAEWAERLLEHGGRAWRSESEGRDDNVVIYLDRCEPLLEGIFQRVEQLLYFCQEPGTECLTQNHSLEQCQERLRQERKVRSGNH